MSSLSSASAAATWFSGNRPQESSRIVHLQHAQVRIEGIGHALFKVGTQGLADGALGIVKPCVFTAESRGSTDDDDIELLR